MLIRFTKEDQRALIDVVMGRRPPTLLITGGRVLNVYTGRLEQKEIAISGKRIAYVGDLKESGLLLNKEVPTLDVSGAVLVPGYIEPHAHPAQIYNPFTLAEKALTLGTTTFVHDNMAFFVGWEDQAIFEIWDALEQLPVKHFWWARLDSQTFSGEQAELFSDERVKRFLSHPKVVQAGELTDWLPLLSGEEQMTEWIYFTKQLGKRVEGHAPGASFRTLGRLAAAGVTADHEAISGEEVWNRLELGYMTTLRHSSIRPDLPKLLGDLLQRENVPWHRLMMTTDGATPLYFQQGFQDYMIRTAIEVGCDPVHAYQMVTLNPAVYYQMDDQIGGIAPGRLADINVLESLTNPRPKMVIANGEIIAKEGKLVLPAQPAEWVSPREKWGGNFHLQEKDFALPDLINGRAPTIQLVNAVITKLVEEPVRLENDWVKWDEKDDRLLVYLIDRKGKWITSSFLRGFAKGIDGLVSSYNASQDLLVIGRDRAAMVQAANHVLEQDGGITWVQGGKVIFHLPLPLFGHMSTYSIDRLLEELSFFDRKLRLFGYQFSDPIYTFLFLSSTHLPQVRLTSKGLMKVKKREICSPAKERF